MFVLGRVLALHLLVIRCLQKCVCSSPCILMVQEIPIRDTTSELGSCDTKPGNIHPWDQCMADLPTCSINNIKAKCKLINIPYIGLVGYEMMDNNWINSLESLRLVGFLNHQRYSYIRHFDLLRYIWGWSPSPSKWTGKCRLAVSRVFLSKRCDNSIWFWWSLLLKYADHSTHLLESWLIWVSLPRMQSWQTSWFWLIRFLNKKDEWWPLEGRTIPRGFLIPFAPRSLNNCTFSWNQSWKNWKTTRGTAAWQYGDLRKNRNKHRQHYIVCSLAKIN